MQVVRNTISNLESTVFAFNITILATIRILAFRHLIVLFLSQVVMELDQSERTSK